MYLVVRDTTLETRMQVQGKVFTTVHQATAGTRLEIRHEGSLEVVVFLNQQIVLQAGELRSSPETILCKVDIGVAAESLRERLESGDVEKIND